MNKDFETRFEAVQPELHQLYMSLYADEEAYAAFLTMLRAAFRVRKPALRKLDLERAAHPDWYRTQDRLGYVLYTQNFNRTLRGVTQKLDYLSQTGISYLHLMPLLESPEGRSDGGYAVSDYRSVQPQLGCMRDLVSLCNECHRRDMAVCVDFVMNHTSEDHEWARRARAGEADYQARYFFYENWDVPNEYEKHLPQVFPTTAPGNFIWCEEAGKAVMSFFYPYQWDLNYQNPAVFHDMTENLLFLCNQGIDVIRLDAVPYIWKELGTDCRNRPQVHTLVRMMRLACEAVCPGTLLLGEVVMEPSKVAPYFGTVEHPECQMLYNVTTMATMWHTVATRDVRLLRHQLENVFTLPRQYTFLNYLRCHDDIGWGLDYPYLLQFGMQEVPHKKYLNDYFRGGYGSGARAELYNDDPRLGDARLCGTTASLCGMETGYPDAMRLVKTLHAFLLTQSGLPMLYSGDELGQLNDNSYHDDPLKAEDSRYLHRGAFSWEAAERRNDPTSREHELYQFIQRLMEQRRTQRAFHPSADVWTWDPGNNAILTMGRYWAGQKLLAFFNFSPMAQTAHVGADEAYTDLLTGETHKNTWFVLPPFGFCWLLTEL